MTIVRSPGELVAACRRRNHTAHSVQQMADAIASAGPKSYRQQVAELEARLERRRDSSREDRSPGNRR